MIRDMKLLFEWLWSRGEVDTEVDTEHVTIINLQCEMNCADFVYAKWIGAESGMCYCLLFDVKIMCSGAWCDVICEAMNTFKTSKTNNNKIYSLKLK